MSRSFPLFVAFVSMAMVHAEEAKKPEVEEGMEERRERGRGGMAAMWKRADQDGDGKVSLAEFSTLERIAKIPEEKRAQLFARFDKNGDGYVSGDEMKGGPPRGGPRGGMPPLEEYDKDRDGKLNFEEFLSLPFVVKLPEEKKKEVFDRMDRDKDGFLTPKDRPPRPFDGEPGRPGGKGHHPMEMVRELDGDGDGALSFAEFAKAPWLKGKSEDLQEDEFEKLDRNQDLKLDASDFPPPDWRPEGRGQGDGGERGKVSGDGGKAEKS